MQREDALLVTDADVQGVWDGCLMSRIWKECTHETASKCRAHMCLPAKAASARCDWNDFRNVGWRVVEVVQGSVDSGMAIDRMMHA